MLGEQLVNFIQYMNSMIREIAYNFNLTPSQYFTIKNINSDGISMSDLSLTLGLDNSTLTRNINKLIDKGLVQKHRSTSDRREHLVFLTESGYLLINDFENKIDHAISAIIIDLNNNDKNILLDITQKLNWKFHCILNELR